MSDLHYTVGKDSSGSTVLKVGSDFVTTLTMDENATIQLIRLLSATLTIASVNIEYGDENEVE